jgi:hypothetical protein
MITSAVLDDLAVLGPFFAVHVHLASSAHCAHSSTEVGSVANCLRSTSASSSPPGWRAGLSTAYARKPSPSPHEAPQTLTETRVGKVPGGAPEWANSPLLICSSEVAVPSSSTNNDPSSRKFLVPKFKLT